MEKIGVILASFGVLDNSIRKKTADALTEEISLEFPSVEVHQAYTSNFIVKKLSERGVFIKTVSEKISELRQKKFSKIILLPTHLTAGEEFDNKIKIHADEDVKILPPLFTSDCSTNFDKKVFETVLDCFKFDEDKNLILIGHGSPHRHNTVCENLQRLADSEKNLCGKIHFGVIEENDTPNFFQVVERLKNFRVKKVLIAPLLFNGGSHVEKDIAGEEKKSWRSRLVEQGFEVEICREGLGTFKNFRKLYIDRLKFFL